LVDNLEAILFGLMVNICLKYYAEKYIIYLLPGAEKDLQSLNCYFYCQNPN